MTLLSPLFAVAAAPLALGVALARPQDPNTELTGVARTEHFELRFRPGSRAEAFVDRVAALVEGDLAMILRELGLKEFPRTIRLYLYDDVADLQRTTGIGSAGHSSPLESHVPCDNDQTRVHELVHVVAEKFTERGSEPRNLFFAEGLANAVLTYVHGVHVDAVAAYYLRRNELPTLAEIHALDDFYGWLQQRPGLNAYDIAGSWMRFLLDSFGAAKVRRYYVGVPAKAAFGTDLAALEKRWHARLAAVELRPGLEALLRERAGGPTAGERNPAEAALGEPILGPPSQWHALERAALVGGDPGKWEERDGAAALVLSGAASQGDWCVARFDRGPLGDAIVRATAQPLPGCFGVQLQLGPNCQAMLLRGQGTFVYTEQGGVAHERRTPLGDAPVDIVLRRRGGKASIWIDGKLAAEGAVDGAPALLGVGCVGGPARFTQVSVRPLE